MVDFQEIVAMRDELAEKVREYTGGVRTTVDVYVHGGDLNLVTDALRSGGVYSALSSTNVINVGESVSLFYDKEEV